MPAAGLLVAPWIASDFWLCASLTQLIHAGVLYFLADNGRQCVWWAMFVGVLCFSGGLYHHVLTRSAIACGISSIGSITLILA